jgi:hypothetical protein
MTKIKKLLTRALSEPNDFQLNELRKLLISFDYKETNAGKTSGSRIRFVHKQYAPICLHKPHPSSCLKRYQIKQLIKVLKDRGHV